MEKEKKILGVQYLRGLAALGVVCCHYSPNLPSNPTLLDIFNFGQTGVFVFFFISGFIIVYSLTQSNYKPSQFLTFLFKRSIRIDPTYYATIILTILLFKILGSMPSFKGTVIPLVPGQIIAHVFYIVPFTQYSFYNHVFWTLGVEFQFYLIIGTLYFLSNKSVYKWLFLIVFSLACVIPLKNSYYLVFSYAPIFALGISIVDYYKTRKLQDLTLPIILLLIVACKFSWAVLILIILSILIVLWFKIVIKQMSFLGDISYSLYLTHGLVLVVVNGVLKRINIDTNNSPLFWMVVQLSIAITVAFLIYTLVEKPSIRLSKRLFYKRR